MPSRWRSACARRPAQPEHLDFAGVGLGQPFADLDRRRLAGAVRAEQAEALAGAHVEIEAVDGDDVLVGLAEIGDAQGGRRLGRNHQSSLTVMAGTSTLDTTSCLIDPTIIPTCERAPPVR